MKAFPRMKTGMPTARSRDVSLSDFSGGLNVADSETSLKPRYSPVFTNVVTYEEYGVASRFGTKGFANTGKQIIGTDSFAGVIFAVHTDGTISKIDAAGVVTIVWNNAIANALPDSPSGWSGGLTQVDFERVSDVLLVMNGSNKPIQITEDHSVSYVKDAATGANVNVPVGKFVTIVSDYTVIAGVGNTLDVFISAKGAFGTWIGDADSDAVKVNVGKYVSSGGGIRGIAGFKNRLVVFLADSLVVFQLGNYNSANTHVPAPVDSTPGVGLLNHRCIFATRDDLVFVSQSGVERLSQALLGDKFDTVQISNNIEDDLIKLLPRVINDECFIVTELLERKIFFFFKDIEENTHIYSLGYSEGFKKLSWSKFTGWNFTAGCSSKSRKTFFAEGANIYLYGNETFDGEAFTADYINGASSVPIEVNWELPWQDLGSRIRKKRLTRLVMDTEGEGIFKVELFNDKIYKDAEGNFDPALTLELVAGSVGGFGKLSPGFGGGRRASGEKFYGLPLDFKVIKARITGSLVKRLIVSNISMILLDGTYHR